MTLPGHGAVEFVLGLLTLFSPALFGFGDAGIVVAVALGSLLMGMGATFGSGRGATLGWHHLFDLAFVIASALAALALALAGEAAPAVYFASLTAVHACLNMATRYVVVH
jgi:hypothetical protein